MKALRKTARVLRFPRPEERVRPTPIAGSGPAAPGNEKRSWIFLVSIVAGILLLVGIWMFTRPRGPQPPYLVFQNPLLEIRFEYPSSFLAGPNYVKASSGSMMTIERHSLADAKKDWVAGLPDVLFPQVLIQLEETYPYLQETGRTHPTIGGRKGVEIVLRGQLKETAPTMIITILIVANDDWVYVARTYSLERYDLGGTPALQKVRRPDVHGGCRRCVPAESSRRRQQRKRQRSHALNVQRHRRPLDLGQQLLSTLAFLSPAGPARSAGNDARLRIEIGALQAGERRFHRTGQIRLPDRSPRGTGRDPPGVRLAEDPRRRRVLGENRGRRCDLAHLRQAREGRAARPEQRGAQGDLARPGSTPGRSRRSTLG